MGLEDPDQPQPACQQNDETECTDGESEEEGDGDGKSPRVGESPEVYKDFSRPLFIGSVVPGIGKSFRRRWGAKKALTSISEVPKYAPVAPPIVNAVASRYRAQRRAPTASDSDETVRFHNVRRLSDMAASGNVGDGAVGHSSTEVPLHSKVEVVKEASTSLLQTVCKKGLRGMEDMEETEGMGGVGGVEGMAGGASRYDPVAVAFWLAELREGCRLKRFARMGGLGGLGGLKVERVYYLRVDRNGEVTILSSDIVRYHTPSCSSTSISHLHRLLSIMSESVFFALSCPDPLLRFTNIFL